MKQWMNKVTNECANKVLNEWDNEVINKRNKVWMV